MSVKFKDKLLIGLLLIISFLISLFLFFTVVEVLSYSKFVKSQENNSSTIKILPLYSENKVRELTLKYSDKCCEEHYDDGYDCIIDTDKYRLDIIKETKEIKVETKNKYIYFSNIRKTEGILIIIYISLFITLWIQSFLFIFVKIKKEIVLKEWHHHLVEWAVNTPPVLGVMGTVIQFALMLNGNQNINEALNLYFFDAAMTTILGGFIYVINLALKIGIAPHINESLDNIPKDDQNQE